MMNEIQTPLEEAKSIWERFSYSTRYTVIAFSISYIFWAFVLWDGFWLLNIGAEEHSNKRLFIAFETTLFMGLGFAAGCSRDELKKSEERYKKRELERQLERE